MRIEIILWGLVTIAGFGLAMVESAAAHANVMFLNENNFNGKRRIVAMGLWRRQLLQALAFGMFLVVGVSAALNWLREIRVVLLILGTLLLVLNSWLDRRDRQRLISWWEKVDLSHVAVREAAVKNTAEALARIEAGNKVVADNLVVAQAAVDGVAEDLAESHSRADATKGEAGEAADAAARGPENGGR